MSKEDSQDFKNSTKCWICDNDYVDNDVKIRDPCDNTEKYVFHNLKNYDSHLIMQEINK